MIAGHGFPEMTGLSYTDVSKISKDEGDVADSSVEQEKTRQKIKVTGGCTTSS